MSAMSCSGVGSGRVFSGAVSISDPRLHRRSVDLELVAVVHGRQKVAFEAIDRHARGRSPHS